MKRNLQIIIALMLLPSASLWGEPVPESKAFDIASKFFKSAGVKSSSPRIRLINDGFNLTKAPAEDLPYYIYSDDNGGGFVIVAGDDCMKPILGYSRTNAFLQNYEECPGVSSWLKQVGRLVEKARNEGFRADDSVKAMWRNETAITKATPVVQYETAQWGQEYPYNDKCPVLHGKKALNGCVATAMAIIMRYYKCPSGAIMTTLREYSFENKTYVIPERKLDYAYDWDNMPLVVNKDKLSPAELEAISRLCADCGQSVKTDYSINSSGAAFIYMGESLCYNFGYDKSLHQESAPMCGSEEEWLELLKDVLKKYGPIPMSGCSNYDGGGHGYVIDGYDSNDFMSINWGWDGSYNGYYAMIGYSDDFSTLGPDFFFCQVAMLPVMPDHGSESYFSVSFSDNGIHNPIIVEDRIEEGVPFTVTNADKCLTVDNIRLNGYSGIVHLRFVHCNAQDQVLEFVSDEFSYFHDNDVKCTLNKSINIGDYLMHYYKGADGEWHPIRTSQGFCRHKIRLKKEKPI